MTWDDFKTAVKQNMPVDATRQNCLTLVDRQIRIAVKRVQRLIPYYQNGHETWFGEADGAANGASTIFAYPSGDEDVRPRQVWMVDSSQSYENVDCNRQPIIDYPWQHRYDLSCGDLKLRDCKFAVSWSDKGDQFWVYPAVVAPWVVELKWDGIKADFGGEDETPFDEEVADAISDYVRSAIRREVDRDPMLAKDFEVQFIRKCRALHLNCIERTSQPEPPPSPTADRNCLACVGSTAKCG